MQTLNKTGVERATPSNVEAEQAVLGSALLDSPCVVGISQIIEAEDFYLEKHRWIWQSIYDLFKQEVPIDFLTVSSALDQRKRLNPIGGAAYLTSLLNSVPTAAHANHYATLVKKSSVRRKLISISIGIAEGAYDEEEDNITDVQSNAIQELTKLNQNSKAFRSVAEIVEENVGRIEDSISNPRDVWGIETGFPQLDRLLGGWQTEGFYVISGNSSVGKTFFLLTVLLNMAYRGIGSGLVSLEMSGKQLTDRLIGMISGIPTDFMNRGKVEFEKDGERHWRRFNDKEKEQVRDAYKKLASLPIFISENAVRNATQMRTALMNLKTLHPEIEVGALDYLQLMEGQNDGTRNDQLAAESRELKLFTKTMPIFALSQKNRENERRDNRKAFKMSDLRDSGGISQDADVILDLYSQDYIDAQDGKVVVPTNLVEAYIGKDRLSRATGKRVRFNVNPLTRYYKDATLQEEY